MQRREPRLIWETANRALAAMLQNPAFSTVPMEELVAASFRIASLMFDTMDAVFPDEEAESAGGGSCLIH